MNKADILAIFKYRCEHYKDGWEHRSCYEKSVKSGGEKIALFDIETSQLKANFGVMLSWAIKSLNGKIVHDVINLRDISRGVLDKRVVSTCVSELKKYDRVVGHYSKYFDIPFTRTRAVYWGIDFPKYGEMYHSDTWFMAKSKLALHSNRQGAVAETILHEDIKTRIHPDIWTQMQFGSKKMKKEAIAYIVKHNIIDVKQLEGNYLKLREFVKEGRTSI
jgi:uncharacterized protein YprB with RNaseH-like and TPR domain